MNVVSEVKAVLAEVLSLGDRADRLSENTKLLAGIPEFDSMAVVSVITALEERLGIFVEDDEISAQTFETVGSLCAYIETKVGN